MKLIERQRVLVELVVLKGNSKEYRRQICHRKNVSLVRNHLAKGAVIIGSCISEVEPIPLG
ncbi:hypothetical protein D8T54_14070 [Vibrio vulnificus]|nr:hypothetical protein D8T54_14070 [Vibrio vulnificus]RZR39147.1 hypothetical protein D8T58_23290 [Vibrio vulnificus]